MLPKIILNFCLLAVVVNCHPDPIPGYEIEELIYYGNFPDGFLWGTATAAYQVSDRIIEKLWHFFFEGRYRSRQKKTKIFFIHWNICHFQEIIAPSFDIEP